MKSTAVVPPTSFHITYSIHRSRRPQPRGLIVLHHGICHSRRHFLPLIRRLNQQGFHAAMIDQQSERAGFFRNWIGVDQYVEGMETAIRAIQQATQMPILGYVLHSMGAMIGEEMQQKFPDLQRPTVLMAPIPVDGAWPVTYRIMKDDTANYIWAVVTRDIHSLASTPKQVRRLFFDDKTPPYIVDKATRWMKHAPFWVYLQLLLRWLLRPKIAGNGQSRLLLYSERDYIFKQDEFNKTRKLYDPLPECAIPGGHDFFVHYAHESAEKIATFFKELPAAAPVEASLVPTADRETESSAPGPGSGGPGPPHVSFAPDSARLPEKRDKPTSAGT